MRIKYLLINLLIFFCSINISFSQWIYQNTPNDIGLILTIDFSDTQNGSGGGHIFQNEFYGRAMYTTNSGSNWTLSQVPDSARALVAMQFFNSSTGYCAGAYNTFFRDKNNSTEIDFNKFDRYTGQLKFGLSGKNELEFGGNYKGLFYKTTDGGQSWNTFGQLPNNVYYLTGLYFVNSNTGYVTASYSASGAGGYGVLKTTNGGINWNILSMPDTISSLRNIYFTNSNTGFDVGYDRYTDTSEAAVIVRTTNAGTSWQLQTFPDATSFSDIYFSDLNTGFVIGSAGSIFSPPVSIVYKTTNAGTNWEKLPIEFKNVSLYGVRFVHGTGTGIIYGNIFDTSTAISFTSKTTNYGLTWTNIIINDSNVLMTGCKLLDQNNWYLSGGNLTRAAVLHSTNGGVGVNQISNVVPDDFKLYQNYPNPFNPTTVINYELRITNFVTLKVYDVLGNEVAKLVNEKQNAGVYEVQFDGNNLPSGIYFYKILAGEFSDVKKMTLIK